MCCTDQKQKCWRFIHQSISQYHIKFDFDASVSKLYAVIITSNQSKDIHVSTVFMFMRGSLCKGRVSKELVIINH